MLTSETNLFDSKIKAICKERNDRWATEILGRLSTISDLFAADAVYHQVCKSNFRTGKAVPAPHVETFMLVESMDKSQNRQPELSTSDSSSKSTICQDEPPDKGRPVDLIKLNAFVNVLKHCEELCDEKNCCTVTELQEEMKIIISSKNLEPCSIKYLKNKLLEHFKDEIITAESKGKKKLNISTTKSRIHTATILYEK